MPRELKVKLVADARPFNNTLDAAIGKVTGFKKRLETTGGGSLTKGLAIGAGVASFNLLTSAISAGVGAMDEMHQAFLDDEASQTRLQNVLKNTVKNYDAAAKAVDDFVQAQIEMGFADQDTRDSVGQLVGVTHDATKAIDLATLSANIARNKNIDLAAATDAVTRAYNGQGRGLVALGIDTRGAANGAELLARAWKNVKGAQDAYAKTSSGLVDRANAKMDESFEKVGAAIDAVSKIAIPIMQTGLSTLIDIAGELIAAFMPVVDFFRNTLIPTFQDTARAIETMNNALQNLPSLGLGGINLGGGGGNAQGFGSKVIDINKFPGGVNIGVPIQHKHSGGVVLGPTGSDQLVMAQAGERVLTKGQQAGGQTIIVNIASFIGSDRDIDRFSDRLAFRLRSTSLS